MNPLPKPVPDISVIICTHNPRADYLRRTLEGLRSQTLPLTRWELLIVDNASNQPLADQWDLSWHPEGRHVQEKRPGLTPARLRGVRESKGNLLVFVDDDNVLESDFLEESLRRAADYPYLGVLGAGTVEPEFEIEPTPELTSRVGMLALRTVASATWSNNPKDFSCMPFGAGMCVTRRVAKLYERLLDDMGVNEVVDRNGQQLFSGGDDLFSWAATGVGLGFGLFPTLGLKHLIQAKRLQPDYFVRLYHDHTFSHGILRYLLTAKKPRQIDVFQLVRVAIHWLRNGKFSAQCQWAALTGENRASRFVATRGLVPLPPLNTLMEEKPSRSSVPKISVASAG